MTWGARRTGYLITFAGLLLVGFEVGYFALYTLQEPALRAGDGSQSGVLESIGVAVGAVAIGIGVPIIASDRLRPLTPRTALFTSTVILLSVVAFPVWELASGHREGLYITFGHALPVSTFAVAIGVALRQRSVRGVIIGSAAVVGVTVSIALLTGGGFAAIGLLPILPILSIPWTSIGFVFARKR